ncbi:uncharacterized protein LOC118215638 [Anguilla anguilla]|uniref:uncharacterized protein LOC118215638 n=1 Tax=Anguilla anguilla TaxID=7936 RepID=UPI0015B1AF7D|nr:uncharacterized protein LOC118215638 [Anguilla anguilla]
MIANPRNSEGLPTTGMMTEKEVLCGDLMAAALKAMVKRYGKAIRTNPLFPSKNDSGVISKKALNVWWSQQKNNKQKGKYAAMCVVMAYKSAAHKLKQYEGELERCRSEIDELQRCRSELDSKNKLLAKVQEDLYKAPPYSQVMDDISVEPSAPMAPIAVDSIPNPDRSEGQPSIITQIKHTPLSPSDLRSMVRELPDLKRYDPNMAFWEKIAQYMTVGGLHAFDVYVLTKAKCPSAVWSELGEFNNSAWASVRFTSTLEMEEAVEKFRKTVYKALGTGSNLYSLYLTRQQREDEPFDRYIDEKYSLYSTYGNAGDNPSKDNPDFLMNVLEGSVALYRDTAGKAGFRPKDCSDLISWAACLNKYHSGVNKGGARSGLRSHSHNKAPLHMAPVQEIAPCSNCGRSGHSQADCHRGRRTQCKICHKYGHVAQACRSGNNQSERGSQLQDMSKDELVRLIKSLETSE